MTSPICCDDVPVDYGPAGEVVYERAGGLSPRAVELCVDLRALLATLERDAAYYREHGEWPA